MDHLSTAIIHRLLLQEQSSTIIITNLVNVQACSKFIQTSFAILQMVIRTPGSQCLYKDPIQLVLNIRIRIKDLIYTRITSTYIFIKIKCHIKISSRSFISFSPPNDKKFFRDMAYDQCLQDIFIFKNLMIHIVCCHYVHIMHVKFL